jgi:radical SAM superfamily enzyme YgiQ (UPF0313 family)
MKILLINPANENDLDRRVLNEFPFFSADAFFAPHACAAVAALTPPEHDVQIYDEAIHGPVDHLLDTENFDIVGISLLANAFLRAIAISKKFRESPQPGVLVAGGACMLHMVAQLRELIGVVFVGEAEETWPQFLKDYAEGKHKPTYRQFAKPDMTGMPIPRWDLIREDLSRYSVTAVQTVRGCPHDCSFCDVIYTYGRKLRFKPIDQVIEEIQLLSTLGVEMIFFADDNFAANRKHTKDILRRIIELNKNLPSQLGFATQLDITIAKDDELLQLLCDANFMEVQIGIESIDPASLEDLNKLHNLQFDLVDAVKKIQSYGIIVLAHMIVGIDSDDTGTFKRTEKFLMDANIVHQACHPLMAPPGTKLWYQLRLEGRLVEVSADMHDKMDPYTNIVPKRMSRFELIEGLTRHRLRVSEPERFLERAQNFIAGIQHNPSFPVKNQPSAWSRRKILASMVRYYTFQAPRAERKVFFKLMRLIGGRSDLAPRVFYALICHAMERSQAEIKEHWATQIIEEERAMPNGPVIMSRTVVVASGIRQNFNEITSAAYSRVRPQISDRKTLYNVIVEALIDYALSFSKSFEEFDDYQRDAVYKSCDRVLGSLARTNPKSEDEMPRDKPTAGFTREILDAMDQTMRFELAVSNKKTF